MQQAYTSERISNASSADDDFADDDLIHGWFKLFDFSHNILTSI